MRTNAAGLALIRQFEGLSLVAYRCPAGVLTIGYGHTGSDVREGMTITSPKADAMLAGDVERIELTVRRACEDMPTNGNQFSAMVALCFNIGAAAFTSSSVLRFHLAGNTAKAAESFLLWNKATGADGKKRELKGLTRRRAAESVLYLTPTEAEEVVDPQRTRAADVEPSPVGDDIGPSVRKALISGGGIAGAATVAAQTVGNVETIWTALQRLGGGMGAHVVMALIGLVAIGAICLTAIYIARLLRRR